LECRLPTFNFREKANTHPSHAGRIVQCQTGFFAALPQDLADLLGFVDFGHCTTVIIPLGEKMAVQSHFCMNYPDRYNIITAAAFYSQTQEHRSTSRALTDWAIELPKTSESL